MERVVELLNTYVAAYFRRVSEDALRIDFRAGNEFDVEGDGSRAAAQNQQFQLVGACLDGCGHGQPGGLNRILFHDLALQQPAQGLNGWAFLGLVDVVEQNMDRIVHEIGHGWMAWPHSKDGAKTSGFRRASTTPAVHSTSRPRNRKQAGPARPPAFHPMRLIILAHRMSAGQGKIGRSGVR